jgi:hypothetical protein
MWEPITSFEVLLLAVIVVVALPAQNLWQRLALLSPFCSGSAASSRHQPPLSVDVTAAASPAYTILVLVVVVRCCRCCCCCGPAAHLYADALECCCFALRLLSCYLTGLQEQQQSTHNMSTWPVHREQVQSMQSLLLSSAC